MLPRGPGLDGSRQIWGHGKVDTVGGGLVPAARAAVLAGHRTCGAGGVWQRCLLLVLLLVLVLVLVLVLGALQAVPEAMRVQVLW